MKKMIVLKIKKKILKYCNNRKQKLITEKKLKNTYGLKKYRIQEVIKPGQVILIQVLKEERGQKGAALNNIYIFGWKIYGSNA